MWFDRNLERLVPPELRDEIAGLTARIEAKRVDLELDAKRVHELFARVEGIGDSDELSESVRRFSRFEDLRSTVRHIANVLNDALDRPGDL